MSLVGQDRDRDRLPTLMIMPKNWTGPLATGPLWLPAVVRPVGTGWDHEPVFVRLQLVATGQDRSSPAKLMKEMHITTCTRDNIYLKPRPHVDLFPSSDIGPC
jgi:hypothetical protein